jgi:hypothetical protein
MVGRFATVGIDEFVLYWPGSWQEAPRGQAVFEDVTTTVMPRLRDDAAVSSCWPDLGPAPEGQVASSITIEAINWADQDAAGR